MLLLSVVRADVFGCPVVVLRASGIIYLHFMLKNKQDAHVLLADSDTIRTPMRYSIIQHDFESTSITNHASSVFFFCVVVIVLNINCKREMDRTWPQGREPPHRRVRDAVTDRSGTSTAGGQAAACCTGRYARARLVRSDGSIGPGTLCAV